LFLNNIFYILILVKIRALNFNLNRWWKFVVGVFGYKNCTFELSFTSSSHKIINLYDGMAHEKSLIQGDSYLFKYKNYYNQTLKFILSTSIGKAKFYINTFYESS